MKRIDSSRGYCAVGLYNPKTPTNVGAALRAVQCYGAAFLATQGARYERSCTDTMAAYRHLPLIQTEDLHGIVPFDCVPVAVELVDDAQPLFNYKHPERAFYIFGPEDGTLGKNVLGFCRDKVYIPMSSATCGNLASVVSTVLYDRAMKHEMVEFMRKSA